MQEVQEPLSGNKLQVQQGTPALSPAEKGPARGPGRRGRSVFYARGWRDMHAVRPAWVRGGAAAQWEAWPLAPTPGVVETAGGSSTGRGRRQGLSGLAELQRGFLECPATGTLEQPWAEKSENPSLPGLWAGLLEHFQFCFSARKNRNSSKQKDSADQNMEGNFQACRNCKRSGAPGHLALHGAHSLLFKVLCPECKEPVLQDTMEEHGGGRHQQANGSSQGKGVPVSGKVKCSIEMCQEERQERRALEGTHGQGWSKVGCAACQQSLPKHLLEIQEAKECQERPVECQFCELAVRLNKVDIHEHPCGRRTEVCPDCGQRIVLHMLARHRDECCGEQTRLQKGKRIPAPESNICCHYCNQMIPGNKYFHHVDRCRPISDSVTYSPVGKPDIPPSSLSSQAAEDQTSTAEKDVRPKTKNTSRFRLLSEKSTRQAPRGTNKTTDLPLKSDGKLRASSPVEDETAYDILRRCSQCGIVLPLPTLTQHQEKCWWLASSKGKQARSSS
nr:XIAP-associated factor 1 isoform X5 [Globicephala melas]XP_030717544.1 XIAP-associated factor 1 isoform X5 [Globicephala melas]XP_030717545.1 XIAP-associated factor 1 isoform X5 [Globicephala melas]XP_030717547.1 XIAP-associated factor 1 isoform X5 [Globicephala melas]XP_030717548.1 XIAP-associated factor 1 isoform X5 [Globicephala melas]